MLCFGSPLGGVGEGGEGHGQGVVLPGRLCCGIDIK